MEQHEEQQNICQNTEVLKEPRPSSTESPPPNCAICLGNCTNKCFTDNCLHQFCFSCLLEWSKIKAECPLCKQPFKSIIYNIKSNSEYEEHIVTNTERNTQEDVFEVFPNEFFILPNGPRPQRHFQYRTTLTLEAGGEFAIEQLLLSHPRTNLISLPGDRVISHRINQTYSTQHRRTIYNRGVWVQPLPDITGRYRECSPEFFRENPAQAHRIIPWLNRELGALLEYPIVYLVQEQILNMLCQHPIQSQSFRARLLPHLGRHTDQFIHEFYNFVRSPYDMIGYDNHTCYVHNRPQVFSLSDDDSDVLVVDTANQRSSINNEVIVIDSDSSGNSSDVILRTPTPPPIVELLDSSGSDNDTTSLAIRQDNNINNNASNNTINNSDPENREVSRSPQLPIKIRLKRNRSSTEICKNYKRKERKSRKSKRIISDSESDSQHPNSDSDYSNHDTSYDNDSSADSSSSNFSISNYQKNDHNYISKRKKLKLTINKSHNKKSSKYKHKKSKSDRDATPERRYKHKKSSKKSKKQKKSKRKDSEVHRSKRLKKIKLEKPPTSDSSSDESDDYKYNRRSTYAIKTETEIKVETSTSSTSTQLSTTTTESSQNETSNNAVNANGNSIAYNSNHQDMNEPGPSHGHVLRSVVNVIVKDKNGSYMCKDGSSSSTPGNRSMGMFTPYFYRSTSSDSELD